MTNEDIVELEISSPLRECILACETFCVRTCCGIDAIDPDEATKWVEQVTTTERLSALKQVKELIVLSDNKTLKVSSSFLNHFTANEKARSELLKFLRAFEDHLTISS